MRTRTTAEWLEALTAGHPGDAVNSLEDLLHDPHLNDTGFLSLVMHPTEGPLRSMPSFDMVGIAAKRPTSAAPGRAQYRGVAGGGLFSHRDRELDYSRRDAERGLIRACRPAGYCISIPDSRMIFL